MMTVEDKQARIDLAAAHRLCVMENYHEGTWNHHTLVLPSDSTRILVTPGDMHWSEVRASDFLIADGNEGNFTDDGLRPDAYHIHYPIHALGPEKTCVLHVHATYCTALSCLEGGRLNTRANQTAGYLHDRIGYYDEYDGIVTSEEQGQSLANALGDKQVLFLANHGVIVTGHSVAEAMTYLYHLERAAQIQMIAEATGRSLRLIPLAEAERLARVPYCDSPNYFTIMKRVLDRREPDYRE